MLLLALGTIALMTLSNAQTETLFDPTDPTYQVQPRYRPDKTSTWTYGLELDGWKMAHDALRGEVHDFQTALDGLTNSTMHVSAAQITALQKWWILHLKHVQSHHRNEDKIVKKFVSQRFVYPDFMEKDHPRIDVHLEEIGDIVDLLLRTTDAHERGSLLAQLTLAWTAYATHLLPHLQAEEDVCIPLMRAYFTMPQVHRLANRLAQTGPRVETGAIVHYVGKERVLAVMEAQKLPGPLRKVAWLLILGPRYRYYQRQMVQMLDILRAERESDD
jgi:hypothetical protein